MYFGEAILNEGFFDRLKKKKEEYDSKKREEFNNKVNEKIKAKGTQLREEIRTKNNARKPTAEEIKNIKSLIKKYIDYYNSPKAKIDPVVDKATKIFNNFYKEMKKYSKNHKDFEEYIKEEIPNGEKFPKLKVEIIQENEEQLVFSIYGGNGNNNYINSDIFIKDMIKKLKQDIPNYSKFIYEISPGEEGEDVLYINFY